MFLKARFAGKRPKKLLSSLKSLNAFWIDSMCLKIFLIWFEKVASSCRGRQSRTLFLKVIQRMEKEIGESLSIKGDEFYSRSPDKNNLTIVVPSAADLLNLESLRNDPDNVFINRLEFATRKYATGVTNQQSGRENHENITSNRILLLSESSQVLECGETRTHHVQIGPEKQGAKDANPAGANNIFLSSITVSIVFQGNYFGASSRDGTSISSYKPGRLSASLYVRNEYQCSDEQCCWTTAMSTHHTQNNCSTLRTLLGE